MCWGGVAAGNRGERHYGARRSFLKHNVTSVEGLLTVPAEVLAWPIPTGGYFLDDGLIMQKQPSVYLAAGTICYV